MLTIKDLKVSVEDKNILKGVSLNIKQGEVHAIMGPNGSGKSTLAQTLLGHPKYTVDSGSVSLNGKDVLSLETNERSAEGLFLAFQYPSEIPGVTIANFLRLVYNNKMKRTGGRELSPALFRKVLEEKMEELHMNKTFAQRYLNEGFSGGEKKRMEVLQMSVLEPKIAILEETDSGLDIDALQIVSNGVNVLREKFGMSVLIITHYARILNYIKPDFVHVFKDGKVIKEGGPELAHELEKTGYKNYDSN
jgi:Fe-S cluster assembly ATP-binding protein